MRLLITYSLCHFQISLSVPVPALELDSDKCAPSFICAYSTFVVHQISYVPDLEDAEKNHTFHPLGSDASSLFLFLHVAFDCWTKQGIGPMHPSSWLIFYLICTEVILTQIILTVMHHWPMCFNNNQTGQPAAYVHIINRILC